jgi:hypothetical protein
MSFKAFLLQKGISLGRSMKRINKRLILTTYWVKSMNPMPIMDLLKQMKSLSRKSMYSKAQSKERRFHWKL